MNVQGTFIAGVRSGGSYNLVISYFGIAAAGHTCVTFPCYYIQKSANLTIQSDDADGPTTTVALSGTGTASEHPGYGSTPAPGSSIDVGTTAVGHTISTTLSISETGDATLVVTPTLSGANAGDFGVTPPALSIPDGGAARALTISCTPTFTGTLAAVLSVAHNAPGSPATYTLSYTGGSAQHTIYLPLALKN